MDFSENIAIKTKSEFKKPIFRESNTPYIVLLCNLVKLNLYIIWAMIQLKVLALCNRCWKIFLIAGKLETKIIVVKSDNAPTQYKKKWAFEYYSSLAKK